jgi:hypothetical protein
MGVTSLSRDTLNSTVKYTSAQAGNSVYDVSAMEPIAKFTSAGSTAVVEFAGIPQTYQDLMLVIMGRSAQSVSDTGLYVRPSSSSVWSGTQLYGDGANVGSTRFSNNGSDCQVGNTVGNSATAGIFGSSITHFLSYSNSAVKKTFITRSAADRNGGGYSKLFVNSTNSTTNITNIVIYNDGGNNWMAGSTFNLYGIRAVR